VSKKDEYQTGLIISSFNENLYSDLKAIFREIGLEEDVILKGIIDDICKNGLSRKAPDISRLPDGGSHGRGRGVMNVIPSSFRGACHEKLTVLCYDKDNFHERLREMLYTAGIICREINRQVIFITSKFDNNTFEKHVHAIYSLKSQGVDFMFIQVTNQGAILLPVI